MAPRRRWRVPAAVAAGLGLTMLVSLPASAHSLDSSTISVHVTEEGVDATFSIALDTLDQALGLEHEEADSQAYADAAVDYLAEHLTVSGADGTTWSEDWGTPEVETIEDIESLSVGVVLDTDGADGSAFTLTYDAVIEAVAGHEAVVVLTDLDGDISTAGVLTSSQESIAVGGVDTDAAHSGFVAMAGHGLRHVLDGADHLLFLATLLLPAPLVAVAGRWRGRRATAPSLVRVAAVVSAFTVGHSLTLIASTFGWVTLPTGLVEILIAVSVGVGAVHAIRPLVPRGEVLIAGGFGLVHGLAFAAILADLGLAGTSSIGALLAFNIGVELAQLAVAAALVPSLLVAARTRYYGRIRIVGATLALAAAAGWILDRTGLVANPFETAESWAVAHLWWIAGAVALLAVAAAGPAVFAGRSDRGIF